MRIENEKFFFKYLRLITPEYAQQLGVSAEAPIFVSPIISEAERYRECNQTFSPINYLIGQRVVADHYHWADGGIYYLQAQERLERTVFAEENFKVLRPGSNFPG